jgi:hypothetical protein
MIKQVSPHWFQSWLATSTSPLIAEEVIFADKAQNNVVSGRANAEAILNGLLTLSFSDSKVLLHTIRLTEDTLILELTFFGCQTGPFVGIPPTHRHIHLPITLTCHLAYNQIQQVELVYDARDLLRQLGMVF